MFDFAPGLIIFDLLGISAAVIAIRLPLQCQLRQLQETLDRIADK
jgi:hypothetical protein